MILHHVISYADVTKNSNVAAYDCIVQKLFFINKYILLLILVVFVFILFLIVF